MEKSFIFFGTGPVALASLQALSQTLRVELVVTKQKPSHHKGKAEVADWVRQNNIPYITVSSKTDIESQFLNRDFESQIGIIVDFGIILSSAIIDRFPLGIINSHFSLLPKLRGADPITFTILEGLEHTGVSLMKIVEALDAGPLLAAEQISVDNRENTETLTQKLISLSNKMLTSVIPRYIAGEIQPYNQDENIEPSYTRQLVKLDGQIDFSKKAEAIEREVRAYIGWPGSFTNLNDKHIIITEAEPLPLKGQPGKAFVHNKELAFFCGTDALLVKRLKPEGKKEMTSRDYLLGHPLSR